jgi:endo-1,4-beta-xylanase
MKHVTFVTSALRRVCPQGLLLAGIIVASVTGLQAQTVTSNKTGTNNGYWYQYWKSGTGSATMTLGSGGNYNLTWTTGAGNVVCGKGWNPGSARNVGYNAGVWSPSGWARLGVYGWTTSPLIEFYVTDRWGGSGNSVSGGTLVGTVTSDGGTYNIHKHQQVNQPSIQGTATFWQYISTRQSQAGSGNRTINTANHISAWKSKIGSMGTFNYMILAAEAYNSSGSCNVTVW